jgi:hypothetical protein
LYLCAVRANRAPPPHHSYTFADEITGLRAVNAAAPTLHVLALGVVVVSLAISIPFAGPLFAIAVLNAGTGALVLERRALFKPPALAS